MSWRVIYNEHDNLYCFTRNKKDSSRIRTTLTVLNFLNSGSSGFRLGKPVKEDQACFSQCHI